MNSWTFDRKDYIRTLAEIVIAYSTFVGVLSAIVYYIADIKGISILVIQVIGIIYILLLLLVLWIVIPLINGRGN